MNENTKTVWLCSGACLIEAFAALLLTVVDERNHMMNFLLGIMIGGGLVLCAIGVARVLKERNDK